MSARPATPEPIARQLRQEAGFGCCKCGNPIFQYHHIVEYSDDEHFRPEDMMVLCPNHHFEATVGAMTIAEQRRYKKNPYNKARGHAAGYLKVNQSETRVVIGGATFIGSYCLVIVDGECLLGMRRSAEGHLLLSLKLYSKENELLFAIEDNEWVSGDPTLFDIEAEHQRLTIR